MTQSYDSTGVDKDAIKAWAEALKGGLGLVRFSELSEEAFDQMLSGAAYKGRDLYLVIAQNATMDGLNHLEKSFPEDVGILRAITERRVQLRRDSEPKGTRAKHLGPNVVAFPSRHTTPDTVPSRVPSTGMNQAVAREAVTEASRPTVAVRKRKSFRFSPKAAFLKLVDVFAEPATGFDHSPEEQVASVSERTLSPVNSASGPDT